MDDSYFQLYQRAVSPGGTQSSSRTLSGRVRVSAPFPNANWYTPISLLHRVFLSLTSFRRRSCGGVTAPKFGFSFIPLPSLFKHVYAFRSSNVKIWVWIISDEVDLVLSMIITRSRKSSYCCPPPPVFQNYFCCNVTFKMREKRLFVFALMKGFGKISNSATVFEICYVSGVSGVWSVPSFRSTRLLIILLEIAWSWY